MQKIASVVVLCLLPLICIATETSYFPDRSASVIVAPKNIQDDSFIHFSDKSSVISKQIEETTFADYVSHLVGGPVINQNSDRDSLKSATVDKSTANLLFVIDSVGSDAVSHYETIFGSPLKVLDGGKSMKMTRVAYPQDSVASLATLATGNTPSAHGIVGKEWQTPEGSPIVAYKAQALPAVASVFDIISQASEGRSLIVSASADYQMASALGLHQYLHGENPAWNKLGFYFNNFGQQFVSLYHGPSPAGLRLSLLDLSQRIADRKFTLVNSHDNVRYVPETHELVVDMASGNIECIFDLNKHQDFLFFAEIEFAYAVMEQLRRPEYASLISDNAVDTYSFAFSTVKGIQLRYGKNSQQHMAALAILDSVLVDISSKLNAFYSNSVSRQVVFLGHSAFSSLQNMKILRDSIYKAAKNSVTRPVFVNYFPAIYSSEEDPEVCVRVQQSLEDFPEMHLEAICPYVEPLYLRDVQFVLENNSTNGTTGDGYPEYVAFQIVLWFSIGISFVLAGVIYALCYMDIGADSSLYRQPNPKFHSS